MTREDEIHWEEEIGEKRCQKCIEYIGKYDGYQPHMRVYTEKYRNTANPLTDFKDVCVTCRERPSNIKPLGRKRTILDDLFG